MGPLSVPEGQEKKYGVQLNSEPTDDVMINIAITRPRDNSPANVYFNSATNITNEWQLIFTSKNWSDVQVVTLYVGEDSVDNEYDDEDFLVIHTTETNDEVYSEKAGNMTVIVRVEDNDAAGVSFDSDNDAIIEIDEGTKQNSSDVGTFIIDGLKTQPLGDVTLKLWTSNPALIKLEPETIEILKDHWKQNRFEVKVWALDGDYNGEAAAHIIVQPQSIDTKYNVSAASRLQPVVIAFKSCLPGEYQQGPVCLKCVKGKFSTEKDATQCEKCEEGKAQQEEKQASCATCSPGKFSFGKGNVECSNCPGGYLQVKEGQSGCEPVGAGKIVADGGGAEVDVPLGSKICSTITTERQKTDDTANNCDNLRPFDACKEGTKGSIPADEFCHQCPQGYSSGQGLTICTECSKGTYSDVAGTSCKPCEAGKFKDQNTPLSPKCFDCPTGFTQENDGSANCVDLNWKNIESCNKENDMYLNDESSSPSQWDCQPCMSRSVIVFVM